MFIGIDLPGALTAVLAELDPDAEGVRWVRPGSMHLTLAFLGNVGEEQEARLASALENVRVTPFFLPVRGAGSFGSAKGTKVLWVGVGNGHPYLFALHRKVQDALISAGHEPDLRSFHPHITIARCESGGGRAVADFLRRHADFDAGMIKVGSFTLYSSEPAPGGSIYTPELVVTAGSSVVN